MTRGREDRRALEAVHDSPHPDTERFDPDFRTAMRCNWCKKLCYGPRHLIRDAMKDHWANECSARHTQEGQLMQALILYPKQ